MSPRYSFILWFLNSYTVVLRFWRKSLSWETSISVPSKVFKASFNTFLDLMSRWFVGSSMISTLKGCNNSLQRASLFLSPPERTFTFLLTSSPLNRKDPSISRTLLRVFSFAESIIVSRTVLSPSRYSAWFWAKYPIWTLWPSFITPVWAISPTMIFAKVDLPCPFWPTNAILLPLSINRSILSRTLRSPYVLPIWLASITTLPGWIDIGNRTFITALSSSSTSIRSILSSFLIRDCAIDAFEALARNFSMRRSVCSICFSWFFWEASCCSRNSSRRTRYFE